MVLIRSPIVCVLGHVDHGKTTLLDKVRGSAVAEKEAGKITQMIGASYLPRDALLRISEPVRQVMKFDLIVPGLLFIDTPGHEAFTNLRERGGSIADISILVVDAMQGIQPQTVESIRILKQCKTPFIVAVNKIDLIQGWKSHNTSSFLQSFAQQIPKTQQSVDQKLYEVMGQLSQHGFDSERFDHMKDFTRQIALVPISARTGEGLAELLLLLAGLSQKYMEKRLHITGDVAKGSILEVKEEKGMGTTIDVVLYDGMLSRGEEIVFLTQDGVQKTRVRALLEPNLLKSSPEKYIQVDRVVAAAGVKIVAPGLESAIPGSPFSSIYNLISQKAEMEKHLKAVLVNSDEDGVIIKVDSLGSAEAILSLFHKYKIPVKTISIGPITRKDILSVHAVYEKNRFRGALFGFNVRVFDDARIEAQKAGTPIIWSNIIYKLVDDYEQWVKDEKVREKHELETSLPWPAKIKVLPGFFFRASKPAVFGIEVLQGKLRKGVSLMNEKGERVGEVKNIQSEGKAIEEAEENAKVALSSDEIVLNKTITEGETLYVCMGKKQIFTWEEQLDALTENEKKVLGEIKHIVLF